MLVKILVFIALRMLISIVTRVDHVRVELSCVLYGAHLVLHDPIHVPLVALEVQSEWVCAVRTVHTQCTALHVACMINQMAIQF